MYFNGLCLITDHSICSLSHEDMVLNALKAGVKWVQHRDKKGFRRAVYEESMRLRQITKDFDAVFIINDHADIALAVDADGVHLGQDDLPLREARKIMGKDAIIGISTHTIEQAIAAQKDGADYIGFGPIFHTTTKDAGDPQGTGVLREIKKHVHIPVVAIGGINIGNVRAVIGAGADAVAVASAILCGDIARNTKALMEMLSPAGKPS
jgi:thiamine-phosphate pyrophosphorylase